MVCDMPMGQSRISTTEVLSVAVPKELIRQLDAHAKYKGVSRSDVLRWALVDFLHQLKFGGRDDT